ncbi:MAG: tetratricopeptide repeat protein, partial [Sphingobacterium sp.]
MKNKDKIIIGSFGFLFVFMTNNVLAQSAYKEASNAFALYTQTGEIKNLDNAKNHIGNIYKTKRDSSKTKVNVLRAMVMSSLAYADSTRSIKLDKDPIDLTIETLAKIDDRDKVGYPGELDYVRQNLAGALIFRANNFLKTEKFDEAYLDFSRVDQMQIKSEDVTYNLALLATKAGKIEDAIKHYKLIQESGEITPKQYIELANLYKKTDAQQEVLNLLEEAKTKYPEDKELLLYLIDSYAQNKSYDAIVPIIDQALNFEPENIELNYLAGYANENMQNISASKLYYQKVLQLEPNNYESNLALGLISLKDFLADTNV